MPPMINYREINYVRVLIMHKSRAEMLFIYYTVTQIIAVNLQHQNNFVY